MFEKFWKKDKINVRTRYREYSYLKSIKIHKIRGLGDILVLLFIQLFFLVLYVQFSKYAPDADASDLFTSVHPVFGGFDPHFNTYRKYNSIFQDVHVMIFIGFGFLMTFLKKYGYSAVGFNFFLGALLIQWAILTQGFFNLNNFKIAISVESLLDADIAVASVLISMGALLGQTTLIQLVLMGIIEIVVYQSNSYLGFEIFKVTDAGASIFVHTFGAYFGLSVSFILNRYKKKKEVESVNENESSSYASDLFAMIGTVFLWLFWPSFNAGELSGDQQHRAIINTYLALAASCVAAFIFSAIFTPESKFDMVHVQNSSLAGGVAVGAVVNMMIQPYGALFIGFLAGTLSVVGYRFITPWLEKTTGIHDTCGVHNLHGLPGVLAALSSTILAAIATDSQYQVSGLYEVFPARAPLKPEFLDDPHNTYQGYGRTALVQAGYQILGLGITVVVAVITGLITGFLMHSMCVSLYDISPLAEYNDEIFWKMEEEDLKEKSIKFHDSKTIFPMDTIES